MPNGIVLIRPDGSIRLIHDFQDEIWGPISVCFGTDPGDSSMLYVVTDGNLFASEWESWMVQSTEIMPAMTMRTEVDVDGAPVPGE
jgi:hypothetical protein